MDVSCNQSRAEFQHTNATLTKAGALPGMSRRMLNLG